MSMKEWNWNGSLKIVSWAISRKERWTGNKLPSIKYLFGYADIIYVLEIEDKMWKREWNWNKPLVILDFGLTECNRKVHAKVEYMLLRTEDLNQNVGYDITYVEEKDVKMWTNELFGSKLLQLFMGRISRKESYRRVRTEI